MSPRKKRSDFSERHVHGEKARTNQKRPSIRFMTFWAKKKKKGSSMLPAGRGEKKAPQKIRPNYIEPGIASSGKEGAERQKGMGRKGADRPLVNGPLPRFRDGEKRKNKKGEAKHKFAEEKGM